MATSFSASARPLPSTLRFIACSTSSVAASRAVGGSRDAPSPSPGSQLKEEEEVRKKIKI
jgi:hypothetical protein